MKLDKNPMLRKLAYLEMKIEEKNDMIRDNADINEELRTECYEDLLFVRGLMDDIECDRITEFPMVEKTNLMTGKVYLEDPNTPLSCSPASETFWSM